MLNIAKHYGRHAPQTRCSRAFPYGKIPCHSDQRMMQGNGLNEFRNTVGAHARIRTGDLFLTKEMLVDQFPDGPPLRSNTEAIAN